MAFLAFLKFGLQEFAVGKPLGIHHPAIYVIMQYLHLAVILGIENERLVVVLWIMLHSCPYNVSKPLASFIPVSSYLTLYGWFTNQIVIIAFGVVDEIN